VKPRCYDCLTEDVAVKLIDPAGFEHWFCAPCWEGWERFNQKLMDMLTESISRHLKSDQ
jgi:hypothetical protein